MSTLHPDLVAISNVWQPDAAIDALKAEHEGLSAAVKKAIEAKGSAEAAKAAAQAAVDTLRTETRANTRELEEYVAKRTSTERMINDGSAPDYAAAERQLAKCSEIVDQLETRALELMETEDSARAALAAATDAVAQATHTLDEARAALGTRDAPLRAELAALLPRKEAAWAQLHHDLRAPYSELRRKKRRVLVNTVEGVCQTCQMRVPANKVNEVALGKALHVCPGCGGYLLP
jgi:predicted  nucleic acid-binding Zn-ribbon protein